MDIGKVKADIKSGNFDDFYIFTGEEITILKIYIDKIAEKGHYRVEYIDSVETVLTKLKMKSILSSPTLYVVFEDKEFLKNEKLWGRLKNLKNDLVVFHYISSDGRLKFWKNFKDRAVTFEHLSNDILTKYIKKIMPLSEKACEKLIEVCESDYGRILTETNKIYHYLNEVDVTGDDLRWDDGFKILLRDGTIYVPPKDAIFDLVAAVMERNPKKVYKLLKDCRGVGEANMVIITVLYDNLRNLLQVQTATGDSISKSTGLNGFQIKLVSPYVDNYTDDELVEALKLLRSLEKGIKVGEIADDLSVDYALINIL